MLLDSHPLLVKPGSWQPGSLFAELMMSCFLLGDRKWKRFIAQSKRDTLELTLQMDLTKKAFWEEMLTGCTYQTVELGQITRGWKLVGQHFRVFFLKKLYWGLLAVFFLAPSCKKPEKTLTEVKKCARLKVMLPCCILPLPWLILSLCTFLLIFLTQLSYFCAEMYIFLS